jgi:NAD-dependent deacetylase
LRPGVVWFGETLPVEAMRRAVEAAAAADLVLVAGTSSMVYPAAGLPEIARATGAWTVEINPERTALSGSADEWLEAASGEILPPLIEAAGLGGTPR